jgi:hypothetical protein
VTAVLDIILAGEARRPVSNSKMTAGISNMHAWNWMVVKDRLSALMDLYIHPLYVQSARFSPLYSIHPHPSILYIILYPLYPLWDPLVTLSKYIYV